MEAPLTVSILVGGRIEQMDSLRINLCRNNFWCIDKVAIFEVGDAIDDIKNAVVMGHQQDRAALLLGKLLHNLDGVTA